MKTFIVEHDLISHIEYLEIKAKDKDEAFELMRKQFREKRMITSWARLLPRHIKEKS